MRTRYSETDQMGIVYHGKYADYLEIGRVEWLRKLGFSYKKMEASGVLLPVTELHINYKKSATYDDELTITTTLRQKPMVRIVFDYTIHNQNQELLIEAHTVLAFMDRDTGRPTRCPDYLLEKLS
ncbi:MAG: thioesterase family protein [Bacteroidota bacterium]